MWLCVRMCGSPENAAGVPLVLCLHPYAAHVRQDMNTYFDDVAARNPKLKKCKGEFDLTSAPKGCSKN